MKYFSFLPFCFTMSQPRCSYSWRHLKCHSYRCAWLFEPSRDKTNKMACAPSEDRSARASTQSDHSSLSAWRKPGSLATHWAHCEDSDQIGPMPRLIRTLTLARGCPGWSESSLGAQSFCWFWHEAAHLQHRILCKTRTFNTEVRFFEDHMKRSEWQFNRRNYTCVIKSILRSDLAFQQYFSHIRPKQNG